MTAWITAEELGAHTGAEDLDFNAAVDIYLEAACQAIRDHIDQDVDYMANDIIRLQGSGTKSLTLPQMPVLRIISVNVDDADDDMDPADYEAQGRSQLVRTDGSKWDYWTIVEIVYDHGYVFTPDEVSIDPPTRILPSIFRIRALEVAAVAMVEGMVGVGGVKSETIGRYQYDLQADATQTIATLTEDQMRGLERYRQAGVA